jgi:hypothetical protein
MLQINERRRLKLAAVGGIEIVVDSSDDSMSKEEKQVTFKTTVEGEVKHQQQQQQMRKSQMLGRKFSLPLPLSVPDLDLDLQLEEGERQHPLRSWTFLEVGDGYVIGRKTDIFSEDTSDVTIISSSVSSCSNSDSTNSSPASQAAIPQATAEQLYPRYLKESII